MEITSREDLAKDIQWLESYLEESLTAYFKDENHALLLEANAPPDHQSSDSSYAKWLEEMNWNAGERLILLLAIVQELKPQVLDLLLVKNGALGAEYTEFGRYKDSHRNGFVPTFETALFLICGTNMEKKIEWLEFLSESHSLVKEEILERDPLVGSLMAQSLKLSKKYRDYLFFGRKYLPEFGSEFPAHRIQTVLDWDDLVLDEGVLDELKEISEWLENSELILTDWGLSRNLKQGYRVLFYGPPGTGKTLAASLIGKQTQRPVYRVDLSAVVSKYIGETEKNLGKLFDKAASQDWVLFFDEADALFGKRTQTKGSNDRYANQEVAYLLQRIEDYDGLVILATNLQSNMDEAFSRRFQSTIYFPKPELKQRRMLWKKILLDEFEANDPTMIEQIEQYELSGGQMINVLRYCAIQAAKRARKELQIADVLSGIRREYQKENKTI
ncbi:MAG: ATP-binding protein [Bacteroidetes bacterium]|nr:MAG: ATP-binding protein [Bacteroidota bacterium]